MPSVAHMWHAEPTELQHHISTATQLGNSQLPLSKEFIIAARIAPDANRAAQMVHDYRGFGKGASQLHQLGKLGEEIPSIEAHAQRCEFGEPLTESLAAVDLGPTPRSTDLLIRVPACGVTDAPKQVGFLQVSFQHLFYACTDAEIGISDNRSDPNYVIFTLGCFRRQPGDELGFTQRSLLFGTVLVIFRVALQEHGLLDAMTASRVRPQVIEQIATPAGLLPEVVMGIDDA